MADEARLRAERDIAVEHLAALQDVFDGIVEAAEFVSTDDEHDPDGATIGLERAQASALLDAAKQRLAEVDEALARVADGRYGICERCGEPIDAARLDALPTARACVACARRR